MTFRLKERSIQALAMLALACVCAFAGSARAAASGRASAKCMSGQNRVAAEICDSGDPRASKVTAEVRRLKQRYALQAVMFGVWRGRTQLVSGALGSALPGVRATREMYFRIGNTTESFETTLLMQLVDQRKIRLDDKLAKWYPGCLSQTRSRSECWRPAPLATPTT